MCVCVCLYVCVCRTCIEFSDGEFRPPPMSSRRVMCNSGLEDARCLASIHHVVVHTRHIGTRVPHFQGEAMTVGISDATTDLKQTIKCALIKINHISNPLLLFSKSPTGHFENQWCFFFFLDYKRSFSFTHTANLTSNFFPIIVNKLKLLLRCIKHSTNAVDRGLKLGYKSRILHPKVKSCEPKVLIHQNNL